MNDVVVVGSLNMDTNMAVPHIPIVGETIIAKDINYFNGGKGANQAISITRLGGNVEMIGAIGNDGNGNKLFAGLKNEGVGTKGLVIKEDSFTGIAIISVADNGDNNIIVYSGANYQLNKEDIDKNLNLIKSAKYCVLQLEIPFEVVKYVIDICYNNNIKIILNPAPAVDGIDYDLISKVDFLLPNESELSILAKTTVIDENIVDICSDIVKKGCKNVIVTLGEKGSLWVNKKKFRKFKALKVNAVDTTAAGDSFIGAFTFMLSEGKAIDEAIKFATKAAAVTVTRKGAQDSLPSRKEINIR